jgi:L-histidine N-alpha-methyltransferase
MAVFKYPLSAVKADDHPYVDLIQSLSEHPRRIPSKYFYDDEGSRLFEKITELTEYYPTACENEILARQSFDILVACGMPARLNVVELGAGDGRKTCHFLKAAVHEGTEIIYRPVDISAQALEDLQARMQESCPGVRIEPCRLDMEHDFRKLPIEAHDRNLVLYLGSSLGNFTPPEQISFFTKLKALLQPGDFLLTGFDLKKDSELLMRAYDDSQGTTREFNMNLLRRLNRELQADFRENRFKHMAAYNPGTGSMESWLISMEEQTVHIEGLGMEIHFDAFEGIHTETSWKFSPREIRQLARRTGFKRVASFFDHQAWFTDELWMCC